jgi:serine/threonine protein kinase
MLDEGDRIREYTLKKFLGSGSYGDVWLAEKEIELADEGIPFALKFLTDQSGKGINTETVKNEVRTWIKAGNNFNIVPVYDGFIHGRFLVIVSEYVDGGSLRDWLESNNRKAPSLEKAVEMIRGILRGLTHLHARKIIHRDLKPENILLKDEIPKITDFGVSRMVETFSQSTALRHTKGAGSPLYMPPEAFSDGNPMPQLDTWSAGVMFYEMLSGGFPFNATNLFALFSEIATKEPKPLTSDVPKEMQEFVSISLVKDISGRFQTSAKMSEALEKAWAELQQRERHLTETISSEVWLERERQRREAEKEAETQRIKLSAKDYFNRGYKCGETKDYSGAIENYSKAIELNPQYASAYYNRGYAYYNKGNYDQAIKDYNKTIVLNPQHANAYNNRGIAYKKKGNYDQAIKDYNKTIVLNPQYANAYNNRGIAYKKKGNYDQAIKDYNKAIELNPLYALAYYNRGLAYYNKGNYDQAIMDYNKAIELSPQYANAYYNRGLAYENLGQMENAKADHQKYKELSGKK